MGAMNERLCVNGSCLTDCTCKVTTDLSKFSMRQTIYPSLMFRYMRQHDMAIQFDAKRKDVNVIDVGCGNGAAARLYCAPFAQCIQRKPLNYLGVDMHCDSIVKADRETPRHRSALKTVRYVTADIARPWDWVEDGWADVLWYTEVIEHVPPALAVHTLKEAYRKSQPNATMMVATPAPLNGERVWPDSHDHEFTREELAELIDIAGWKVKDMWGVGVNWTQARGRLTKDERDWMDKLRGRISPSIARAVMQALKPEVCDDLAWLLVK